MLLKDGRQVADPRLDAVPDKDERNRRFPVATVMRPQLVAEDKRWPTSPVTDQGSEGACVGHGCTGFAAAMCGLDVVPSLDAYAYDWYHATQHADDWPGCHLGAQCQLEPSPEAYGGTSVKAGGQNGVALGLFREFRWAFGIDEALRALTEVGPLVLGVAWYEGMYTAPEGKVVISGAHVGFHCIKADAVFWSTEEVEWQNSWGSAYGSAGRARLSFTDLDRLLREDGEAMVPIPAPTVLSQ